jgi:hypothetical protein
MKPHQAIMIGDDMQLYIRLPKRLGVEATLLDSKCENKNESVDAFVYNLNQAMETIISKFARS